MELREYLSVRRAYNLVRQQTETARRLTFEEYAILCNLDAAQAPIKTSQIADYQGALRPTMTHRTNHLASLNLIERGEGVLDRRNIVCSISEEGRAYVAKLAKRTVDMIPSDQALARVSPNRLCGYVDAMGTVYCTAGDLVLLSLYANGDESSTITGLVDALGLLQPTVSMAVGSMADKGYVMRVQPAGMSARSTNIVLTDMGRGRALEVVNRIYEIVVRRRPRTTK